MFGFITPASADSPVNLAIGGVKFAGNAAATRNGTCEADEFCYYYNSDNAGSVSDFPGTLLSVPDYGTNSATCYVFKTSGRSGYNQCIKNNAASVWNRTTRAIYVYYNSNYGGSSQMRV